MNIKRLHRSRKLAIGITCTAAFALLAGTATAGIVSSLGVANRTVSGKSAKIVVDRRGDTIYELGGESLAHLQCVNWTCLKQFPPVEVRGYNAKLPSLRACPEGDDHAPCKGQPLPGDAQQAPALLLLGRHPGRHDQGQDVKGPGGTWHVVKAG